MKKIIQIETLTLADGRKVEAITDIDAVHKTLSINNALQKQIVSQEHSQEANRAWLEEFDSLKACKAHHDYCRSLLDCPSDDVLAESIKALKVRAETAEAELSTLKATL